MKKDNQLNTNKPFRAEPVLALFGPVSAGTIRDIADILDKREELIMCLPMKDTDGGAMFDELNAVIVFSEIIK